MGTNFYVTEVCQRCGQNIRNSRRVHIGKESAGWPFIFQGSIYTSWKDWKEALRESQIEDEYGTPYTLSQFANLIERLKKGSKNAGEELRKKGWEGWIDPEGYVFSAHAFF